VRLVGSQLRSCTPGGSVAVSIWTTCVPGRRLSMCHWPSASLTT